MASASSVVLQRWRTRTLASPELRWWHRQFGEVEEMMVELWERCSGWWCDGGYERAWQSLAAMAMVLGFALARRERERERGRESERE